MEFNNDIKNLAILSLITVIIWMGFEVYFMLNKSSTPEVLITLTKPLDPELDTNLLNGLKERKSFY